MAFQTVITTETLTTGTTSPGGSIRVEVPTLCDDLHSTPPPPGVGEAGYGVPYTVEPVSEAKVKLLNALKDLAESGLLHNETIGMKLEPYAETIAQMELWMTAGESTGQLYTLDDIKAPLAILLERSLGRKPTEEEVDAALKPIRLDITSIRMKTAPPTADEHLRLLTKGGILTPEEASAAKASVIACACTRIICPPMMWFE